MNVLLLSQEGDGLGVAQQIASEGHNIKVYIESKRFRGIGSGIVERVSSWRPHIRWADLIVCDMVGFGKHENLLSRASAVVFGCSRFMDAVELDRGKGMELMRRVGINIPKTYTFDNAADAKNIPWPDGGVVIKPHDNAATSKTAIITDYDQFLWLLDNTNGAVTIQHVVHGVEVSTEGWFNGRDFLTPFNHTFEEKRLMENNSGPQTGCMGNVVIGTKSNKLTKATVERLTPVLRKANYRGPVDINAIVTANDVHGLEFSSRLGYDAIEALMAGLQQPVTNLLYDVASGKATTMQLGNKIMIAVRLSKYPWPSAEPDLSDRGLPIQGLSAERRKYFYMTDVFKDGDTFRYGASDGVIGKATASGFNLDLARKRVYRTVDGINYPDKQFRSDIGVRYNKDKQTLTQWGWL